MTPKYVHPRESVKRVETEEIGKKIRKTDKEIGYKNSVGFEVHVAGSSVTCEEIKERKF